MNIYIKNVPSNIINVCLRIAARTLLKGMSGGGWVMYKNIGMVDFVFITVKRPYNKISAHFFTNIFTWNLMRLTACPIAIYTHVSVLHALHILSRHIKNAILFYTRYAALKRSEHVITGANVRPKPPATSSYDGNVNVLKFNTTRSNIIVK